MKIIKRNEKVIINNLVLILLFITCYLLFGCKDIIDDPYDAPQTGYGRVVITIMGASARTVFPMMAFAKYEYLFARVIDGQPVEPEAQTPVDGSFTLEQGDWQITVNAYIANEDTVAAVTGTSAVFSVSREAIAHIVIQLTGNAQTGNGSFSYRVAYPEGTQINAFTLENLLDGTLIIISGNGQAGGGALVLSGTEANVPAGYYYLTIELTESEEDRTAGANEVVYIYDKLDSEYNISFTIEDFSHIHEWGYWTPEIDPTETADGQEMRQCERDVTHTETRILYATGTTGLSFSSIGYPVATAYSVSVGTANGVVHIPAMYRINPESPYLPVTEIGYGYSDSITSIEIPASITNIASEAFRYCSVLSVITVNENNQNYASDDNGILYNKTKTVLIRAPRAISDSVSIPDSVTSIGNNAFDGCGNLIGIDIPASVMYIGSLAFLNCNSLTSITVNEDNPSYTFEGGILYNKAKTQIIAIVSGISGDISIPPGITSIGDYAFYNFTDLASITIPASVTSIGNYAFSGCTSLTTVTFSPGSQLRSIGSSAFNDCTSLTGITIPSTVRSIGYSAFNNCNILTGNITIPAGVTSIESYTFAGCTSLTSVTLPSTVTSIGYGAFQSCSGLTSITIPASVTSIDYGAFQSCSGLTSITIPASVTSIGNSAFWNCTGLTSITVDENNLHYASQDGILYNKAKTEIILIPAGISGSVTIPAGVTEIGSGAFQSCSGLTSITIPASVTTIGSYAFYMGYDGNSRLTTVTFAEDSQLRSIGEAAFQYCTNLTSITIPVSVTEIGNQAFYNCTGLTSVTIPTDSQLQSIGNQAFAICTGLASITIPASVKTIGVSAFNDSSLTSVTFTANSQLTTIGAGAFYGCRFTSITIPASVTSIGSSAFFVCGDLTSVTILTNSQLQSIGSEAFYGCYGLVSIDIPASVTSIGDSAFYGWHNGQTIYIRGHGSEDAADNAWGSGWRNNCDAFINYLQ